ncbi:hypothetical protein CDL12_20787 [Handroanthus impetiginosus]|uniref:At4g15545-like C-terminal domain-containing protein n=1 Tax=Handroanthus impetiginosus TaxID=429701 RepID=A0A2G9GMZ8_9LAMI|nr:hypothetical protein CDL12_20787 [Handroanthus impetiginosus]
MLSESGASPKFNLPEELLEVLPSDPFQSLIALESELSTLHQQLTHRDAIISDLESQLDASLSEAADKLAAAQQEKGSLLRENAQLSFTLKKLNRDVAKLEAFRQTLVKSLQEDEDNPVYFCHFVVLDSEDYFFASDSLKFNDATLPSKRTASMRSRFLDAESSYDEDDNESEVRAWVPCGLSQASETSTPQLTPSASPPTLSASVSPLRTPKPVSLTKNSTSFSTERGFFDDTSPTSSSQYSSTSNLDSGSQSAKARVHGKEFFRQVRNRLSYEQFGAFLANVKELNSHKQTKEETLRKADEIFGQDNKDLYVFFEGLITRNV